MIAAAESERVKIHPLNFSRDFNGVYQGQHLFLICGGPSLSDVDPAVLRQPGIVTMGINNSPSRIRPNLWIAGDAAERFLLSIWRDPTIIKFAPDARRSERLFNSQTWQWEASRVHESPNVVTFTNQSGFSPDRFFAEPVVRWGDRESRITMVAAIRVAAALGFCRINLVGCDWQMAGDKPYGFTETRVDSVVAKNNRYYRLWSGRFAMLRPIFDRAGLEIRNATPGSHLQTFPRVTLEQAIADAKAVTGVDPAQERTEGMYGAKPPTPESQQRMDRMRERRRHRQ